jgi:uncharacterized cupin superfamily protein
MVGLRLKPAVKGETMVGHKYMINLSELPWENINGPQGSRFDGVRKRVGMKIGAKRLGYSFYKVPPGKTAFPYHTHTGNEEMIYVLGGNGVLRLGQEELDVRAGSVVACLPGSDSSHQLINTGKDDLHYLVVSTMEFPDITQYPDSNKIGALAIAAGAPGGGFRAFYESDKNVDYYAGEDGNAIERVIASRSK